MNPIRPARLLTLACIALAGLALRPAALAAPERFVFAAMGCVPYGRGGDAEAAFLRLIAEISRHEPAFTVHLGDILGSDEHPTDALLRRRLAQFNSLAGPLIYTPGDNEWTDSHNAAEGSFDPLERLAGVRAIFFPTEQSLGQKPIPLLTQRRDRAFAKFVENARWTWQGVVFATVHAVGSSNNDQPSVPGAVAEFEERDRADEAWIRGTFAAARAADAPGLALFFQADPFAADHGGKGYAKGFERFLRAIEEESIAFKKPVLLVHADEHRYRLDFGMRFRSDAAVVPNVTRIESFGDFAVHGLIVVVDPLSPEVFLPGPLLVPGNRLPVIGRQNNQVNSTPR